MLREHWAHMMSQVRLKLSLKIFLRADTCLTCSWYLILSLAFGFSGPSKLIFDSRILHCNFSITHPLKNLSNVTLSCFYGSDYLRSDSVSDLFVGQSESQGLVFLRGHKRVHPGNVANGTTFSFRTRIAVAIVSPIIFYSSGVVGLLLG